jgi:hypothetical protein
MFRHTSRQGGRRRPICKPPSAPRCRGPRGGGASAARVNAGRARGTHAPPPCFLSPRFLRQTQVFAFLRGHAPQITRAGRSQTRGKAVAPRCAAATTSRFGTVASHRPPTVLSCDAGHAPAVVRRVLAAQASLCFCAEPYARPHPGREGGPRDGRGAGAPVFRVRGLSPAAPRGPRVPSSGAAEAQRLTGAPLVCSPAGAARSLIRLWALFFHRAQLAFT